LHQLSLSYSMPSIINLLFLIFISTSSPASKGKAESFESLAGRVRYSVSAFLCLNNFDLASSGIQ